MPKEKQKKKSVQLRHTPLGQAYQEPTLKNKQGHKRPDRERDVEQDEEAEDTVPEMLGNQIFNQARDQ
jgi:hypothetical protein